MITLSKPQARIFVALAQQRREVQVAFQEIQAAETEQVELLRAHYGLPEGDYRIRQVDSALVLEEKPTED